jgi:hypothetical protein
MPMRRVLLAVGIIVASLSLVGCSPGSPASAPSTAAPSASVTASPSPVPAVATGLVVSLDQISVINNDGSTGATASFSSGSATLALLSDALGSTPTAERNDTYGLTSYDWGALTLTVSDYTGAAFVSMTAAVLGGLTLRTPEGIHVGSTAVEFAAVASPGTQYPAAGAPVALGLEARPHPGTQSLAFPGRVGLDYIAVDLEGGLVARLRVPSGDWQDI